MNELALFAGAGGGILGGQLLGWRTICAVEIDAYCRAVLMQRQNDAIFDPFPIWDNIRTFDGTEWCGVVDVVSAGFPCQPFSAAGQRKGTSDERNLWPETIRVIREIRPRYAFLENVPGLLSIRDENERPYFGRILGDLAEAGFDAKWGVHSAAEVGAPHLRKRIWIVADANDDRQRQSYEPQHEFRGSNKADARSDGKVRPVADTQRTRESQSQGGVQKFRQRTVDRGKDVADTESIGERTTAVETVSVSDRRQTRQEPGRRSECIWWDIDPADMGNTEQPSEDALAAHGRSRSTVGEPSWRTAQSRVGRVVDELADRLDLIGATFGGEIPRVAGGIDARIDRLRALGNGQVPICAVTAWLELTGPQK